jgi:drug/metabolite transporter (DMT)-like permease
MALGFCGVVVLSLNGELRADLGFALLLGCAPVGWALGSMLARKLPSATGLVSPALHMITGGLALIAVAFVRGEPLPSSFPPRAVIAFAYLVVAGSLLAFSAYAYLLKSTRPALAMSYSYVNPPIAVAIGALLGHEAVGAEVVGAVALIGAGTFALLRAARA